MTSEHITDSSLSDEPDNLAKILQRTRLQLTHEQRRADDGSVVTGERLPNCVPTPVARKALTSWIWDHGHPISRPDDQGDYIRQQSSMVVHVCVCWFVNVVI